MNKDATVYQMPRKELELYVARRIQALQGAFLATDRNADAARKLAVLRRSVSKAPGATPEVWMLEFDGMPDSLRGRGDEPSSSEWAVHAAISLYAVHQQSQDAPMHKSGFEHSLGAATRSFVNQSDSKRSNLENGELPRRFAALVTADSLAEVLHYARQLVQQLRSASIPLDYACLAGDFMDLQNPNKADAVRLAWGRGYAQNISNQENG